ncbi:hypothetical protein [Alkalimarinus sediminis]|uniref:Uncharacterized protein n=1 Tax=Alkalimarinus sediminis TaxID=1632866 RepID=A0A9E8HKB2_9ALTE|nr:hypothetical protein [Alkalimarinus sediminis]UZW75910.1 hypothetical protein NNL22_04840 [Alkalimarinus sediminis]
MTDHNHSSNANSPDLDWSQVKETINMLTLAVAQIESSMKEGEQSVSDLTEAFTFVASKVSNLAKSGQSLQATDTTDQQTIIQSIREESEAIHSQVSNAIVAFQFYDRLSQRLEHVKRDLMGLSTVIGTPEQLYNPAAWSNLQKDIASNYTMEAERIMFEHIMKGATIEQALEIYKHHFDKNADIDDDSGDEIELF